MELLFRNADGNLSQRQRDYAIRKLSRLDRYNARASRAEVAHSEVRHEHLLHVTVNADGEWIRGQAQSRNFREAVDHLADLLENRLKRRKEKQSP